MLAEANINPTHGAADSSAASGLLPREGEVAAKVGGPPEGATGLSTSATSPLPSNPKSQIQNPQSGNPDLPSPARRQVPLVFNPIINDEANILAAITRGDRTLFDLAEEHGTTVANFAIWLQREDIHQKLSDLTSAGTTLTRVAAVNQLPKAVKAMAFQIEAHIFDRTHNLIKPGLSADKIAALRDANARKACNLLLRLAKFDPSQPLYRAPKLLPRPGEVAAKPPEGARSPDGGADGGAVKQAQRRETEGALALLSSPSPQPDTLDLCFSALAAIAPQSSRNSEPAIPAFTSDIRHPTSDIRNGHHHNGNGNGKHTSSTSALRHLATSPRPRSRPPPH